MKRAALTRSEIMARVRGRDTKPEMLVRRLLHGLGYRYRLHAKGLPGRPDLAFTRRRAAVFVHGCFWHAHGCGRGARTPKSNAGYWSAKLARNRERDREVEAALAAAGWRSLAIWECELSDASLAERLADFLGPTRDPCDVKPPRTGSIPAAAGTGSRA